MKRYARLILALAVVALLATPRTDPPLRTTRGRGLGATRTVRMRYGFRLTESATKRRIDFVHQAPTLDAKLAHIMPQVASMGAAVSLVDVDADGLPDLYVTNSKEGSRNRLYRNRGDGTFEDVAGRLGLADVNQSARPVCRWGRSGATTTTTATRICSSTSGAAPSCFTTMRGRSFTRCQRRRLAGLGEHQLGGLARLRSRWTARLLPRRLLSRTRESLESRRHEDDAGELRVRDQRRPQVPVSEPGRRALRRGQRTRRAELAPVGAGCAWPRICGALAILIFSSRTTTACRSCSSTRADGFREVGREAGVGYAPKSGMNASVGRRVELGAARPVRLEHLGGRHPAAGQQSVGAESRHRCALTRHSSRTWPLDGGGPRRLELRRAVRRSQ